MSAISGGHGEYMSGGYMALENEAADTATLVPAGTSFDFVFSAHNSYVYRVAHTLLGNAQDAEDVTQEVFLRVYKALPRYDPERANMRTWITKLTVNACKTHRRRNFFHYLWKSSWPSGEEFQEDGDDNALDPVDLSSFG